MKSVLLLLLASFPWAAGGDAPAVARLHLGDTRARLEAILGAPTDLQELAPESLAYYYRRRGLIVLLSTYDGVTEIRLVDPKAGSLDGVRVGDTREAVLAKWGQPSSVNGSVATYKAGSWQVQLQLGPQQKVVSLSLARSRGTPRLFWRRRAS